MKQKLLLLITFLGLMGCADDVAHSSVPNVKFSLEIPLISFPRLSIMGETLTLNQTDSRFPTYRIGWQGVIVVHSIFEEYKYHCYDRACPKDLEKTSAPENGIVTCAKCKTRYNLYNWGAPENASSKNDQPLKNYKYIFYEDYQRIIQIAN